MSEETKGDIGVQETKYQELKRYIDDLQERVSRQHQLMQSTLVLLKNMDARIDATKELNLTKGTFAEREFQILVDHKLGLREKDESEDIVIGDVVWVAYRATMEGTEKVFEEDSLPLRVGSNAAVFETALIGRRTGTKGIIFTASFAKKKGEEFSGKSVEFTIDILKVKTKLGGNTDGPELAELESEPVSGGVSAADPGSAQPEAVAGGSGLESGEHGSSEPVPSGGSDDACPAGDGSGAQSPGLNGVCGPDSGEPGCPDSYGGSAEALNL
jgi:hypothetical protein